jgi:hypothetical protein
MSKFIGRLVQLGIAKETERGAGAAPVLWVPQVNLAINPMIDEARIEGALGSIADSEGKLVTEKYCEGELTAELRDQSFGFWLYNLLGSVSSETYSGAKKHSYSLLDTNNHQSLALTAVYSDLATEMLKLVMINRLELTANLDGLVQYLVSFTSKAPATSSATPSNTSENKFSKKHVNLKIADDIDGLAAATALEIKTLSVAFEKNVERDSVMGTIQPIDILNRTFSVEGSVSLTYEDNTIRDYMLNGDEKALQVEILNDDVTIGTTNPSFKLVFPKVDFSGWTPNLALEDIVSQTVNFKANYDLTNGVVSTCELVNEKESY